MSWNEVTTMSLKEEFVRLASAEGANISQLCKHYNISRPTGYKWLMRHEERGNKGLHDQSRRPKHSPHQTPKQIEKRVLKISDKNPGWGGRKIHNLMVNRGEQHVPAASTITSILRRHGCLNEQLSKQNKATHYFEHELPNDLWQMDYKGHFAMHHGRCHPLTIIDDHSRFSICLQACSNERRLTVKTHLTTVFKRYGLPVRINVDNGPPWGTSTGGRYTVLSVWLIRLGIKISYSAYHHPQTNGKCERFHRSLKAEVLNYHAFRDLNDAQCVFDDWRDRYNMERPHEALDMLAPISRYKPSNRHYAVDLKPVEYGPNDIVRKVRSHGYISYEKQEHFISEAFRGQPVALRPTRTDGLFDVYYCHQKIKEIDLRSANG